VSDFPDPCSATYSFGQVNPMAEKTWRLISSNRRRASWIRFCLLLAAAFAAQLALTSSTDYINGTDGGYYAYQMRELLEQGGSGGLSPFEVPPGRSFSRILLRGGCQRLRLCQETIQVRSVVVFAPQENTLDLLRIADVDQRIGAQ
jgi:hypothetical protein